MVTQKRLKELLEYNAETGVFTWLIYKNKKQAGYVKTNGYRQISINKINYPAHKLAWLYVYGKYPIMLDHKDHNRDNNAILNLREVTNSENSKNMKQNKNNKTGIVGVSLNKSIGKWEASITVNMKPVKLGFFTDIHLAIKAREEAEKKYNFHPNHGENCINYEYINRMQKYIHNNKKGETNRIAVAQYSKENQLIKVFESAKQAEELTGTNRGHISAVCKGKRKTANSFIWKYYEPFLGELPTNLKELSC